MKKALIVAISFLCVFETVFAQNVAYIKVNTSNERSYFKLNRTQAVEWESFGVTDVHIYIIPGPLYYQDELTFDNSPTEYLIAQNIPASQMTYDWSVTEEFQDARIKIVSSQDPTVYDYSDMPFSTYEDDYGIKIKYPKGGEHYKTGDFFNKIVFRKVGNPQIRIQISTDGQSSWSDLESFTYWGYDYEIYSPGAYAPLAMEIPNTTSSNCYLRILDYNTDSVFDITDSPFSIQNSVSKSLELTSQLDYPNVVYNGYQCTVSWEHSGLTNVNIEYTLDDFIEQSAQELDEEIIWQPLVSNYNAANGSYSFTVDNTLNWARFKISDSQDATVYDISEDRIQVAEIGDIRIMYPEGGETLDATSDCNKIFIKSLLMSAPIKLELSVDGMQSWTEINQVSYAGVEQPVVYGVFSPFTWTHDQVESQNCFIRVVDGSGAGIVYDTIAQPFTLSSNPPKKICLQTQTGGPNAYYEVGSEIMLQWQSHGVSQFKIEKTVTTNFTTTQPAFDAPYQWELVAENIPGTDTVFGITTTSDLQSFRFKVTDMSDPTVYDITEAAIFPVEVLKAEMISPSGGEELQADSVFHNILWKNLNSLGLNGTFEFSSDNGSSWQPIDVLFNQYELDEISMTYSQVNWKIPQVDSDDCLLRVIDSSTGSVLHTTPNTFSIRYTEPNPPSDVEDLSERVRSTFLLYPNPSNGSVEMDNGRTDIDRIKVYDSKGSVVFESFGKAPFAYSFNLPAGPYFFTVQYEDGNIEISKLVIQ